MEIASRIVVMNQGRVEQSGTPTELYEHPATEFVMSFVGKVNRVGDAYIRPHEVVICSPDRDDCLPATVDRAVMLGFDNRIELTLQGGERVWAQVTRQEMARLTPFPGQVVGVDLSRRRRPGAAEAASTSPEGAAIAAAGAIRRDRHPE